MPRWQRWALEASKPRIEAQHTITDALRNGKEYTPGTWFDLTMYATGGTPIDVEKGQWEGGDRELAEKRYLAAVERKHDRDLADGERR